MSTNNKQTDKKYQTISNEIRNDIRSGKLHPGEKLGTERELSESYNVSRPTVTRALNDLAHEGLIERRAGSGSFVSPPQNDGKKLTFCLFVPGYGHGTIFDSVCSCIADQTDKSGFALIWGGMNVRGKTKENLVRAVRRCVSYGVDGVFLQPAELLHEKDKINRETILMLEENGIPVILLDADYVPFPERSGLDIVGIDNTRAAWIAARHLIRQGSERIDFVGKPYTASTLERRMYGCRLALLEASICPKREWEHFLFPDSKEDVQKLYDSGARDIICVNDETAAELIITLEELGISVPEDVRIIGFDDVKFARLARVPLTTISQPCEEIGVAAVNAMMNRLNEPGQAPCEYLLEAKLMIRKSSIRPTE
ncbi:MAG: GntR family transcriptional regulator [Spirochaetia bacterium]|nr:GntR family transcriptional regulator [Spirochaetia bacterium]